MGPLAIIPARGGSKRIPNKNIRDFAGVPMIAHSINEARLSGLFDRIIISTDDPRITEVSLSYGAEVPFRRPAELSNDHATIDQVLVHAVDWLKSQNALPEYICCIFATAPFIRASDLKRGLDIIKERKASTAMAVTTFAYPIFRSLKLNDEQRLEMFWPENRTTRSQDLPEAYHDAGQFYWVNCSKYVVEKRLYSSDSVPVHLPRHLVQDIDTAEDWVRAELMFNSLRHNQAG